MNDNAGPTVDAQTINALRKTAVLAAARIEILCKSDLGRSDYWQLRGEQTKLLAYAMELETKEVHLIEGQLADATKAIQDATDALNTALETVKTDAAIINVIAAFVDVVGSVVEGNVAGIVTAGQGFVKAANDAKNA